MSTNPFDYIEAILVNKKVLITDSESEKAYSPFLTNRALSYHTDTILHAQEMNINHTLDKRLQNDYLINSVRSTKRKFVKWAKKIENKDIDLIREYYEYNYKNAKVAYSILSKEQIKIIKEYFEKVKRNE